MNQQPALLFSCDPSISNLLSIGGGLTSSNGQQTGQVNLKSVNQSSLRGSPVRADTQRHREVFFVEYPTSNPPVSLWRPLGG